MSSKAEKEKQKLIQEKCQTILNELLRDEDNKYCVDCDAKGPRWASWNLGIFLCIRCAGIHRNLGVHISKVKSVNLDSWTPEQVVTLQQMGNSRARAVYEANLPDNFRRPQHDSSLEAFIRAKYEQKKYIAKEWVQPPTPKVDWDKEIEESRKKKEKKKTSTGSNSSISIPTPELHAIPKPKSPNSTPKPIRVAAAVLLENKEAEKKANKPYSAAIDLLGLETPSAGGDSNGDDIFSNFLSAPNLSQNNITKSDFTNADDSTKKRSAEEESFFNQPANNVPDKKPLTKDSIMALYSQGSTQQPQQPTMFNMQGGMFPQFGAFATPAQPVQNMGFGANGMMPMTGMPQPQNGMFGVPNNNMGMVSNPFFATGMPQQAGGNFSAPAGMMQEQQQTQDLMLDFSTLANPTKANSSFQLPQQMARMNISGQQALPTQFDQSQNFGQTPSSNLWQ